MDNTMRVFVDTDFAGCHTSRRSTSGGVAVRGAHCIKHWSTTQTTVALSSGEAELYAANYGSSQALGVQSMSEDLGISIGVHLHIDAKATMGIINRQGLGKVRHLAVQDLWLQSAIKSKRIRLSKVPTEKNVADLMTKPLAPADIARHLAGMNVSWNLYVGKTF